MKRNRYSLRIDNPCEQNWTSMTEISSGKFCSHCSKKVVDFTNLSDVQIIQIIEQASGKICGRLNNHQMNRQFIQTDQNHKNLRFPKILAGLLLVAMTEKSFATKSVSPIKIVSIIKDSESIVLSTGVNLTEASIPDSLKSIVQGRIIDGQTKDFLPGVIVRIKNAEEHEYTNSKGEFKIVIPASLLTEKFVLQVLFIGYETVEITINKKDLPLTNNILLKPRTAFLGEVVVIKN